LAKTTRKICYLKDRERSQNEIELHFNILHFTYKLENDIKQEESEYRLCREEKQ